jgi:hypothetical protein
VYRSVGVIAVVVLVAVGSVHAQTVGTCAPARAEAYLDVGNVRALIRNDGRLFNHDGAPAYEVPRGVGFGATRSSLLIGGVVDESVRVAGVRYLPDGFWPGPLDDDGRPPDDCVEYDRLYTVSRRDLIDYDATGHPSADLAGWPTGLGAPSLDASGVRVALSDLPFQERRHRLIDLESGERPDLVGDQMIWWVMNDLGNVHESTGSAPLGVEVQGLAYAFDTPGPVGNATFYRYTISNRSQSAITDTYVGMFAAIELGDPQDDWVGSDSTLGLGFGWNADNRDVPTLIYQQPGYGSPPPAIAYDFFQGPIVPDPGSEALRGGDRIADSKNLSMTNFVAWLSGGGGIYEDPQDALEYYNYLRSRWKDGSPVTEGLRGYGGSQPARFMFSGDAATCSYWSQCDFDGYGTSMSPSPGWFIASSGPFEMGPGDRQEVVVGIVYGRGSDNFDSVTALKEADVALQAFVDSNYERWPIVPPPPWSTPRLVSPADLVQGQPLQLLLRSECPDDVLSCHMELSTSSTFSSGVTWSHEHEWKVDLEPETTYWWRSRGLGRDDAPGPWSEVRSFRSGSRTFGPHLADFQVIANGAGRLDPPECGAFAFNDSGFPLVACGTDRPNGARQQSAGVLTETQGWGIHAGGASGPFGPATLPGSYLARGWQTDMGSGSTRALGQYDYLWRFTEEGGKGRRVYPDSRWMDVPFEIWRTPQGTLDDPSDDVRLVPFIYDRNVEGVFDIGGDHHISGGVNDPYSDWVFFNVPADESPGQAGYEAFFRGDGRVREVAGRQVLVCWNCGTEPPYPQPYPEVGTVFRYVTNGPQPPILSAPASGPAIRDSEITFYWEAAPDFDVMLQVSTSPSFETFVARFPAAEPGVSLRLRDPGEYYWRVGSDEVGWSETWVANVVSLTGSEEDGLPTDFALEPAYPNPFNPATTIRYALPVASPVRLEVFDVLGRRVAVLVDAPAAPAGVYEASFDANRLSSGVYLVVLKAGAWAGSRSIVLLR